MPVLPLVLVNGAEGIGTGWSTSIPNFNPLDIVANLRRLLNNEELVEMHPWYNNFKGSIEEVVNAKTSGKSYAVNGIVRKVGASAVASWTNSYLVSLLQMLPQELCSFCAVQLLRAQGGSLCRCIFPALSLL